MRAAFISVLSVYFGMICSTGTAIADGALGILDSTDIEISNNLTAKIRIHKIIEITSESGADMAEVSVPVNDFMEIDDIEGFTLLPGGRKIKIKSSDIKTASAAQTREFGGYRVVLINLRSPVIGAVLNYRYTLKLNSLLYLPRIVPDFSYDTRRFVVRVTRPDEVGIRFDYGGFQRDSSVEETVFHAEDIPASVEESNSCPGEYFLYLSADKFKYGKEKFSSEKWADVGKFFRQLSRQPRQSLDVTKSLAERLVEKSASRADSVEAIFDYVADSVTYVSLELGKSDFNPHLCDLIIERRFGDCKDQAVLLSTLYNEIGFGAYPVLVATGEYQMSGEFHPWPSLFDHVVVKVTDGGGNLILDPSDPNSLAANSSSRLRGKYCLVADGVSGIDKMPSGNQPTQGMIWNFNLGFLTPDSVICGYELTYRNAASGIYAEILADNDTLRLVAGLKSMLFQSEWHISTLAVDELVNKPDSVVIRGHFMIRSEDPGSFEGLSLGSPILESLLKIFTGVRSGDYCTEESYDLEEIVRVDSGAQHSGDIEGFHEVWVLDDLEFSDEMTIEAGAVIYRRSFAFTGNKIPRENYNAFRDFVFSMRSQRYIHAGN